MRLCIPTHTDEGLEARSFPHFGRAPYFTIVDTDSDEVKTVANADRGRSHGTCHPLSHLGGEHIDAIVCGSIGRGAFGRLAAQEGLDVYRTKPATVGEIVTSAREGNLHRLDAKEACHGSHRGHQGQHRHHRRHGGGCVRHEDE